MSFFNMKKIIKGLAIIIVGILLSGMLYGQVNILAACMRLIGAGTIMYTIICSLKDKKYKHQDMHTQMEYNMMLLISGIASLLASVMEYKTVLNIISMFWIIVIIMAVIRLWKDVA